MRCCCCIAQYGFPELYWPVQRMSRGHVGIVLAKADLLLFQINERLQYFPQDRTIAAQARRGGAMIPIQSFRELSCDSQSR